jgi:hypothetical protein
MQKAFSFSLPFVKVMMQDVDSEYVCLAFLNPAPAHHRHGALLKKVSCKASD